MIRNGKAQKIDEVVEHYLKQFGLDKKLKECEIENIWAEVVGRMIASRTKGLRINNGKLFVSFTSSVIKHEMQVVKEGLIAALNEKVGSDVVKEIVIY
ncbi:hypothetical protein FACS1894199_13350 [Bacteroidia bacterium]|nr:hypothetical protein FACS1894199_13350 [Bacteroidia bacterium]